MTKIDNSGEPLRFEEVREMQRVCVALNSRDLFNDVAAVRSMILFV